MIEKKRTAVHNRRVTRKAKDDEEDEEVRRRKLVRFLKKLEREEKQNKVLEFQEVEVNVQEVEGVDHQVDPSLVEKRRQEEMDFTVERLKMSELCSW